MKEKYYKREHILRHSEKHLVQLLYLVNVLQKKTHSPLAAISGTGSLAF
jgi:hypothetical protein